MGEAVASIPAAEYKLIPGFPNYRVGNDGSVWSYQKKDVGNWKQLKPRCDKYKTVVLYPGRFTVYVHTLVLALFIGPRPPGMLACHKNGIGTDNAATNLRWGTPSSNNADQIKHGTRPCGEDSWNAALTNAQVLEIRDLYQTTIITHKELARMYSVSESTIRNVVNRKQWKYVE